MMSGRRIPPVAMMGLVAVVATLAGAPRLEAGEMAFAERVAAQEAIERIYWSHRIWPKENQTPKPPIESVMTRDQIVAKVEDSLRKSNAVAELWHRAVTAEQLQAELDRMAAHTHDREMLAELFRALGNDPRRIAETLARQALTERQIRDWYQADVRFHGALKRRAEAALAACRSVACMPEMGGEYSESTWRLDDGAGQSLPRRDQSVDRTVPLGRQDWNKRLAALVQSLGGAPETLPLRQIGPLEESPETFSVTAALSQSANQVTVATVVWNKVPFESWWAKERDRFHPAVPTLTGRFTLPSPAAGDCVDDTWTPAHYVPDPRSGHVAVWTGSEMIIWGGAGLATGGRYDPSTDVWTTTSTGAGVPAAIQAASAVWTGTEMIVWGGYIGISTATYTNTGGRYDPATNTWKPTSTGPNVPTARDLHVAVWTGQEMIVWGGYIGNSTYTNTGGRYDPSTDSWEPTSLSMNVPTAREGQTAVWSGTVMIVWGGYGGTYLNTGGRYDPGSDTWLPTSTGANSPSARLDHTAIWTGSRMIVWGGRSNLGGFNTGGLYDPVTDVWSVTSTGLNVPHTRAGHTAVWTGARMIVWGGGDGTGGLYDPVSDTWLPTSLTNAPPTNGNTTVWSGSEMIVWGGNRTNAGGRYSPATDTWVPTAGWDVPAARVDHVAVWTGTEMIIWGGQANTGVTTTGGRYVRATDTWLPTSTGANVPSARSVPTAIWTGKEMIVWGGASSTALNTGGRYDPMTDAWSAMSMANVPSARGGHTAIWTGREMIVWGGGAATNTNSGGRYDPASDTWVATSVGANVPAGRSFHSAVWTGTEMIVWGGGENLDGPSYRDGGRYDPSTDSWEPTSLGVNVPTDRTAHTAVWTGAEMIVWGGCCDWVTCPPCYTLSTGGRYNPVLDQWTPMSTSADILPPREGHMAFWTGREMIVYGGRTPSIYGMSADTNTGGRYDPSTDTWTPTSTQGDVPQPVNRNTAVWTGTEMIVWGGSDLASEPTGVNTAYRYCACTAATSYYLDADGDGYGDSLHPWPSCGPPIPAGYVANSADCDDADPSVWSTPVEVGNLVVSGGATTVVSWTDQSAPSGSGTAYDLVSGALAGGQTIDLASGACLQSGGGVGYSDLRPNPDVDAGYWYLIRARNACGVGTYGTPQRDAAMSECP